MTTPHITELACPRCGHRGSFHIDISAVAYLDATGASVESDYIWDAQSVCVCVSCRHEPTVGDFGAKAGAP